MTSGRLMRLLRVFATERGVTISAAATKRELLESLVAAADLAVVLEAARVIEALRDHPVFAALTAAPTPATVLDRWIRLERFGHTHHRTRVAERDPSGRRLVLEHYGLGRGAPTALDDLFIWGIELTLLELSGFSDLEGTLDPEGAAVPLFTNGHLVERLRLPASTSRLSVSWRGERRARHAPSVDPDTNLDPLTSLFERDLCASWRLVDVARELGLSPRGVQRRLASRGLTFSELLHKTRVERAYRLMRDPRLSLTEIAFCAGFSDQAHFVRIFRRFSDVPPSAYRAMLAP